LTIGLLAAVVLGLVLAPGATGIAIAYGYVLTAPLGWLTAPIRRRWMGPDSVAPPRTRLPSVIMPVDADPRVDGDQAVMVEDVVAARGIDDDEDEAGGDLEGDGEAEAR
ncbi:MAG TPA: hypothetical protein VJN29_18840, partial [Intrasporangium sp.]|nr:hypothetical protein [Intrasporangium sp.]